MKKIFKRIGYALLALLLAVVVFGLVLAFLPTTYKTNHPAVSPEEVVRLRENFTEPHHLLTTTDGESLFVRRWDPDTLAAAKKNIAVLILHGFTAHSGYYDMAGKPISAGGYTTFGLDYRGHGLSGGNRGDVPSLDRWIADFTETIAFVKSLGFSKVVVMGHSLGVASAMVTANANANELSGLILLSGAYEGRPGLNTPPTTFENLKLLSTAIFRPSHQAAEYYRKGMIVSEDPLTNYRYTVRFLTMLDVKRLRLQNTANIPVLVGAGDEDELFEVQKVKDLYELIPGDKKEFLVMQKTSHAKIPIESWQQIVDWLDRTFI
jgi:alpha-beta hydrolase superfamily lysophospholipase